MLLDKMVDELHGRMVFLVVHVVVEVIIFLIDMLGDNNTSVDLLITLSG